MRLRPGSGTCVVAIVAITAAAVGIAPAGSQEIGGLRFAWEINLTTLTIVAGGAFTWWLTVMRQGDTVAAHARTIARLELDLSEKVESDALKKVQDEVEGLNIRAAKLELEHSSLKDEIYKDYLNAASVREIKNEIRDDMQGTEKRVMDAIRELSERVDRFASQRKT